MTVKQQVTDMVARAAEQEKRIAALEARGDATAMLAEIQAGQQRIEEALRGLVRVIPEAMLSKPVPLKPDEVKLILRDNPEAKFRALAGSSRLEIRPNDVFKVHERFATADRFVSHVRGGLTVIAA